MLVCSMCVVYRIALHYMPVCMCSLSSSLILVHLYKCCTARNRLNMNNMKTSFIPRQLSRTGSHQECVCEMKTTPSNWENDNHMSGELHCEPTLCVCVHALKVKEILSPKFLFLIVQTAVAPLTQAHTY